MFIFLKYMILCLLLTSISGSNVKKIHVLPVKKKNHCALIDTKIDQGHLRELGITNNLLIT